MADHIVVFQSLRRFKAVLNEAKTDLPNVVGDHNSSRRRLAALEDGIASVRHRLDCVEDGLERVGAYKQAAE